VAFWSHEAFFDAWAYQPELAEWAWRMRRRYLSAADDASTAG